MKKLFFLFSLLLLSCALQGQLASISGRILKVNDQPLPGLTVWALDENGSPVASAQTDAAGEYSLGGLPIGATYTIQPAPGGPAVNGVTTLDVVLGSRHILGIQPLDNPFYLLAADVNQSGSVSTFDMALLRQLILQVSGGFPVNTPFWRFFRNDIGFPDPSNPWLGYIGGASFILLNEDFAGFDFIAVKTGDLNGDAQP